MLYEHRTKLSLLVSLAILIAPLSSGLAQNKDTKNETPKAQLGISTDFGDVLIENLGIGRTYNLRELAGTPLKVRNQSSEVVDLDIEVTVPTDGMISKKRQNMGVVPIPSLAWVSVGQSEFIVPPGETAFTDVIFTIPDDPDLYGKKFQASIHSRTTGENFLQLGVWSHMIFTIIDSPEMQAELEKNRKRGLKKSAEFTLLPDKVYLEKAPLGRAYDIRKENKRTIKIANSGENPVTLKLEVIPVSASPISLQDGFEQGSPGWLKAKKTLVELDIDSVVDPGWTLHLPNDPKLKGKKLMFIVKIEPASDDVTAFTFYGRFYVEVE